MLIVRLFRRLLALFALPAALFALWWYATAHSTNFYVPPLRSIIDRFRPVWTAARLNMPCKGGCRNKPDAGGLIR